MGTGKLSYKGSMGCAASQGMACGDFVLNKVSAFGKYHFFLNSVSFFGKYLKQGMVFGLIYIEYPPGPYLTIN